MTKKNDINSRYSVPIRKEDDCPEQSHKFASIFRRKTQSECPGWEQRSRTPPKLQHSCCSTIARACEDSGSYFLKRLDPTSREKIVPLLSTDLPVDVSVPLIREESFWRAMCREKLHGFDVEKHGNNHKRCYLETLVARSIEQYTEEEEEKATPHQSQQHLLFHSHPQYPSLGDDQDNILEPDVPPLSNSANQASLMDCEDLVKIAKDNVFSLKIRQVRRVCEEEETFSSDDESYHEDGIVEFVPPSKAGMVSSRRGHTSRREVPEESLNYHVVDYLKFILALPNLKSLELRVLQECGIDFSWNRLDFPVSECDKLGKALAKMPKLRHLKLYESRIDDERVSTLVEHLMNHPGLQSLELPRNAIGPGGAASIAKMVKKSPTLHTLGLGDNKLGPEGALQISSALQGSKISTLDLSMNEIGNQGATSLFKAIKRRTSLEKLDISANGLDSGIAQVLAEVLRENVPGLAKLDVSCNALGEAAVRIIHDGLKKNKHIRELDLRLTGISDAMIANIKSLLIINSDIDSCFMPSP